MASRGFRAKLPEKYGGSMRRVSSALLALAVSIATDGAWAAGPVKPPASLDARGIDDWRREHIQAEGWALLHADGAALSYAGGPSGVSADKDGFLHVDVRREYYKSQRLGPADSRSNLQTWVIDCDQKRLRITAMNFYSLNNMKGTGFRKSADEAVWAPVDPSESPLVERICAAAPKSR